MWEGGRPKGVGFRTCLNTPQFHCDQFINGVSPPFTTSNMENAFTHTRTQTHRQVCVHTHNCIARTLSHPHCACTHTHTLTLTHMIIKYININIQYMHTYTNSDQLLNTNAHCEYKCTRPHTTHTHNRTEIQIGEMHPAQ